MTSMRGCHHTLRMHKEERHWAAAGIAVAAIGVGVSAYAASESAAASRRQAEYNEEVAEQQGAYAREQGRLMAEREERRQRRVLAAQHVAYAASGIDTSEGTPLIVAMDSIREAERDLALLRYGTDIRAFGFAAQAEQQRMLQGAYRRAGALGAGVALATGASNIALALTAPTRYQPARLSSTELQGV